MHASQIIIDAVRERLTGLPSTGGRVFEGRAVPLEDDQLPALLIDDDEEAVTNSQWNWCPRVQTRQLTIQIRCVAQCNHTLAGASNLTRKLRQMRSEVEQAIGADHTLGDVLQDPATLVGATRELSGDASENVGVMRIDYRVTYRTLEDKPDAML